MSVPLSRIGSYDIQRELGRGGMGVVYLARDRRLDRLVAIKALPQHLTADPERLGRFESEARMVASLNHPGIAAVYAQEEQDGQRFLVMEYVAGETLAEHLRRQNGRGLPVDQARDIARGIAEALEAAHDAGLVHRDLKPGNVMITPDGKVKVLDFGLARQRLPAGSVADPDLASPTFTSPVVGHSPTIPGTIMGTVGYMSPEQARGQAVGRRSDIFSLGCVLYEMLAGRQAFAGDTVPDSMASLLAVAPDWRHLPPGAGPALRRILARCLEKEPRRRYGDMSDVAHDLVESAQDDASVAGERPAARRPGPNRLLAAAAAVATLGTMGFGWLLWREYQTRPVPPQFNKLTFSVQFITSARLTADGRTVVFSAARDRMMSEVFVRRPEDIEPRKLGPDNTQLLAVSRTGELAVLINAKYLFHRTYVGTLARMPLSDAPPRAMLEDVTAVDWAPNGTDLAVIRRIGDRSRLEYPIGTTLAESTGYLSDVRISPRGDRVAFMEHDLNQDNRGAVVVVDRVGGRLARSPEYRGEEGLAWAKDGQQVMYSAQTGGSNYVISALGVDGTVRAVLTGADDLILHDVHASGALLLSTETNMEYLVSRLRGQEGEQEELSMELSYPAAVSADGRSLLYTDESSVHGPNYAVRFRATAGAPSVVLGEGYALGLSPDSRSVVVGIPSVPPRLLVYATGAGAPRDISAPGFVAYRRASFFRDGTRVLVCGTESGKGPRCYARGLPNGELRPATPEGTEEGSVSPDGQKVVARRPGVGWFEYSLNGGEDTPLAQLTLLDEVIGWSADGEALLVSVDRNTSPRIERVQRSTGRRTLVRQLTAGRTAVSSVFNVVISADEQSYAYTYDRSLSVLYAVDGVR